MLTNEERIKAIHKRAAEIEITKRRTQQTLIRGGAVVACLAGIVLLSLYIPRITDRFATEHASAGMQASILSGNVTLGYIAIGVIAFLLGCFVTIFCMKLKKWQDDTHNNSEQGKEE